MKHSVLIVDDEKIICDGLSRLLSVDYTTYQACNGRQALDIINGHKDIDIILCDIMMPEMDGAELIGRVREANKKVGIIIITAFSTPDAVLDAMRQGADTYLIKPVDIDQLELTIKNTLVQKSLPGTC